MAALSSTRQREAPRDGAYWSKRTFGYGVPGTTERSLDRGQVFKLEGLANDKLLVDLAYVAEVPVGSSTYACRLCGAEFIDMGMRDGHARFRHETKTFVPPPAPRREYDESSEAYKNRLDEWSLAVGRLADMADEQRDKHEDVVAPLDLTKTAASRA